MKANYTAGHRKCNTKKDKRYHNKIYFVDNLLTKYQMIKFIDFCEVGFLPEPIARVAAIVGDHRCHTPRIDSKGLWMYPWGIADQAASTRCQS
ncbi:hypothetical protein TNCV_396491 [Trichonephila clavipes]|nr:hypothetical protein TNCV_396491 [Trichonephila clavipes]